MHEDGDVYIKGDQIAITHILEKLETQDGVVTSKNSFQGFADEAGNVQAIDPVEVEDDILPKLLVELKREDIVIASMEGKLLKVQMVTPDENGECIVTHEVKVSDARPEVILTELAQADVQIDGEMATFTLSGEVFDPIADNFPAKSISEGGADIVEVVVFIDDVEYARAPVTRDTGYETANQSFWRQHPYRGTFEVDISIAALATRIVRVETSENLAQRKGFDAVWLQFSGRVDAFPRLLEGVVNMEGTDKGEYHPTMLRITKQAGSKDDFRFLFGEAEVELEEEGEWWYPKGGSKTVQVYVPRLDEELGIPRLYRITYYLNDESLVIDTVEDEIPLGTDGKIHNVASYRMGLKTHLGSFADPFAALSQNQSMNVYMSKAGRDAFGALTANRVGVLFGRDEVFGEYALICESWGKEDASQLLVLSSYLPSALHWQKLIFMLDHWDDVKPACAAFAIPPEAFFTTLFTEYGDNDIRHVVGEEISASQSWIKPAYSLGLANIHYLVAEDNDHLGYNLHTDPYMKNAAVPPSVSAKFASLSAASRTEREYEFQWDNQLSIWVHAARMRAIADTLVAANPDRFSRRTSDGNYDWTTDYIGLERLRLANFVMMGLEQGGFARIPDPTSEADRLKVDLPHGTDSDIDMKVRTNLGYLNVWRVSNDSNDPVDWEGECSGNVFGSGYGLCTNTYFDVYKDTLIIFDVFKKSSSYGEGQP